MNIPIAFSPCPNDTFMFYAMIHGKVDTAGFSFEPVYADVEQLNHWAFEGKYPVTKLSFHAMAYALKDYALLRSGSALGFGVGPLLISKQPIDNLAEAIKTMRIAIPGKYTTANFLLDVAFPKVGEKVAMLFSDVEEAVLSGKVDAGVIIHENRFTYAEKGLHKLIDLGEYWERKTSMAIPLGGIVAKRGLGTENILQIERILQNSIKFAFENPEATMDYVSSHAQEMDTAVMKQHIALYVNEYSVALGDMGEKAVETLFRIGREQGSIPALSDAIFI